MFSSIFSTSDPKAPSLHPVTDHPPAELYGELTQEDLGWVCAGAFATETHTWYHVLEDGSFLLIQVLYSAVGLWYPQVTFNCRIYHPETKEKEWRSVGVSGFVAPMPGSTDRRSCKSDHFTIAFSPATETSEETYLITAKPSDDLQISLNVCRPAACKGFKIGDGPKGGYSYFGSNKENPDGYIMHKFWPLTTCSGTILCKGKAITANGHGMFVHGIQGMRPNLIGTKWNFAFFQSRQHDGVSAIMMECTTTKAWGKNGDGSGGASINVGCVVAGGQLLAVSAETLYPDEKPDGASTVKSRAVHHDCRKDKDTGHNAPTALSYHWAGPSLLKDHPGNVTASIDLSVGDPESYTGLIEKVDVLAEIPKMVKTVLAYAAGVKPYIYTWYNPATLTIAGPGDRKIDVQGTLFSEAPFIQ